MAENVNASYWAILPASARYSKELSANEKLLYVEISALTNQEGFCWASNQYFAEFFNVAKTSISHWITHLTRLGFLRVELERNDKKEVVKRKLFLLDPMVSKNNTYGTEKPYPMVPKSKENNINTNNINLINSNSHCDETFDTTSSVNDSSSVANAPSSESLSNEEAVNENTECTSSPTTSEDSLSQTSNTFSTSTITQTPKEKESVPAKEKEKVSPRDVVAHYSERWEIMRERGHVNTDCPPQSYPMIGKLVKSSGATLEQLQKVIDEGFKHPDPIILNSGYPLKTMLSSWWVNKVLNGSLEDPNKNRYSKQPASPNKLNKNAKYSEENWKYEKL